MQYFSVTSKAAMNMLQRIKSMALGNRTGIGRKYVDGQVHVILNNREKTIFHPGYEGKAVKDFSYVTIKKSGQNYLKDTDILATVIRWVLANSLSPQSVSALKKRFKL